jgi:hypothetical protein
MCIGLFRCLGITNKCINSYQFIVSLCCSYMFRQLYAILRELIRLDRQIDTHVIHTQPHTTQNFIKFYVTCGCVCVLHGGLVCIDLSRQTDRYTPRRHIIHTQPHITQNFINQNPNWHVTQKVQTSSLRMAHSCQNM